MVSDTTANMFNYAQLNSLNDEGRSLFGLPASDFVSAGTGAAGFFACDLPAVGLSSRTFQFGVSANLQGLFGLTAATVPTIRTHRDIMPGMRIYVGQQVAADWPQISDKLYCSSIKAGKRGDEIGQNLSTFKKTNSGRYNSHPIGLYLTKQRPPGRYRRKAESQGGTTPTS